MTYSWRGRLTSFVRTVATRRDLAALVKTACLYPSLLLGVELDDACAAMRHAADALQVDLVEVWKKRGMDGRERSRNIFSELHRQLFLGHFDGVDRVDDDLNRYRPDLVRELLAVLFALLPNLKNLAFRTEVGVFADVPATAMSALGVPKLPLQTLETGFIPKYLSRLTQDLECLTLDCLGRRVEKFDFPRLKSVCLRGLRVNEDFGRIVESCPDSPSSFAYETSGVPVTSIGVVQPSDAVAQLSKFCGTLKSLRLDLRFMTLVFYRIRMDTLPSLEDSTALESLFLTTNAIYHANNLELADENFLVNILPPSIVSLTLAKTTSAIPQRLRRGLLGLAEYRQRDPERFCKLKLVECDTEVCFDSYIKEALGEVSIDLEYEEFPRQDWSYDGQ
ncbi:hypothetical protein LRP88_05897 [Fusarium phalaenopsidis]